MASYHRRICAVCGRVLDLYGDVWSHGLSSLDEPDIRDHPAIPVRDDEVPAGHIRPRCDFCFADDPEFVLPVRTFSHGVVPGAPEWGGAESIGDWAACGNCAEQIQRNDWKGLLRRAMTGFEARHETTVEPQAMRAMRSMYRTLRKNVTGPLYRLGDRPE